MVVLPLSILALAAGIYLLIKVNREYLGGLFKFLAWLVILLSVLSVAVTVRHGVHKFRHRQCGPGQCQMHERVMIKEFNHDEMEPDGMCPMGGCKMVGDSVILDRAMCEKMMGKDSCEKLCKERGQCIMSKQECAKMCGGNMNCGMMDMQGGMGDGKAACCKDHDKEPCTMGAQKGTRPCCKK